MRAAIGLDPMPASVVPQPVPTAAAPAGKALGTWGAIGIGSVVAALLVGGGTMLASDEQSVELSAPKPPTEVAPPTQPAPTPAVTPEPRAPEPAAEQTNTLPRAQRTHVSPPSTANAASLREEIRLIDSARIAVKKNESARAVSILDQYARRFPNGTFREEARVLRTEALRKR
jgi:hypothetical protein